jgi:arsenate reductase
MPITLYHNPRCSKSRAALALLEERGVRPRIVEYLKTPPEAAELARIVALLKMRPRDLLRPKEAREAGVDPALADAVLIDAMVANPAVIERPIAVGDDDARLGRPPERVLELL